MSRVRKVAVSRITSKGQVSIPREIRQQYRLQAGDQLEWAISEDGTIEIRRTGESLDDLVQILPPPRRAVSIEEMDRAVGAHLADKHRARR